MVPHGLVFACFLGFLTGKIHGQTTVFEKDVIHQNSRNEKPIWGPNSRYFRSSFYGMSFILPVMESDSMAIQRKANSHQMYLGSRYKLKLSEHFALGGDVMYMRQAFRIRQDSTKNLLSIGSENDKQRLAFHSFALGLHLRINFDKRGNYLGKYIDMGVEGHYLFSQRDFVKNRVEASQSSGAQDVRTTYAKLDYIQRWQEFAVVRIGWSRFVLSARYRFSDVFKPSNHIHQGIKLPELPRWSVGLELLNWNTTPQKKSTEIEN